MNLDTDGTINTFLMIKMTADSYTLEKTNKQTHSGPTLLIAVWERLLLALEDIKIVVLVCRKYF